MGTVLLRLAMSHFKETRRPPGTANLDLRWPLRAGEAARGRRNAMIILSQLCLPGVPHVQPIYASIRSRPLTLWPMGTPDLINQPTSTGPWRGGLEEFYVDHRKFPGSDHLGLIVMTELTFPLMPRMTSAAPLNIVPMLPTPSVCGHSSVVGLRLAPCPRDP
jgi:hypothetical protein